MRAITIEPGRPGSLRLEEVESLSVIRAPRQGELQTGDHVVGIVRYPDPRPCAYWALGEGDMCRNGRFTEQPYDVKTARL
ncbi:MAG TPA: hypothetical protein VFZ74_05645 [Burkholderiales bacterium]